MRVLLDPGKGKLRVKEWEREALGMLIDGLVSVSFVDGDGEEARRVGLDEALPREVLDHFGGGGTAAESSLLMRAMSHKRMR